jgi:hypothetical protein
MRGQQEKGNKSSKEEDFNFSISWKKWQSLSSKEQFLLKEIGVTLESRKAQRTKDKGIPYILAPKPYTLGIEIKCVLCNSIHYQAFKMIQVVAKDGTPVLIPSQIDPGFYPFSDKYEKRKVSCCSNCPVVLKELPKEVIIHKTLVCASTTETWRIESKC